MPRMDAETLERLELKIAYLEQANTELSDVVYRQHRELDELRRRIQALSERLDASQSAEAPRRPEDERPPHY